MPEIPSQLSQWNDKVTQLSAEYEASRKLVADARDARDHVLHEKETLEEAREIVQNISQSIQQKVHARIAGVVSRCLSSVFEEPYEFRILFERKRGRTEAQLVFERDGKQVDPLTASGGGCVDVAALALRLTCMMLKRPLCRRVLVMDEPFKSPSAHYRGKVKEMMEALSKEMGVQFIMVTNIEELETGEVIGL